MYDIAISGAGPAGSALALLLASRAPHPERIIVLGKVAPTASPTPPGATADPRTLALNHGSRMLLEQLEAWPASSADIRTVHVSQAGRLGRSLIQHAELGVPRLGSVAAYDAVLASLHAALRRSGVTVAEASQAARAPDAGDVSKDTPGDMTDLVVNGEALRSRLLVRSDGMRPKGITRHYGQEALLATVRVSRPRPGWAFERFTRRGPLAFLPHPGGSDIYGIVWCNPPQDARRLQTLPAAQFEEQLHAAFGDRLGALVCLGERHVFPLSLHAGPSMLGPRCVAIGNAAQTLHPVAGQGLNLGLRDAAQLALTLAPWLARPEDDPAALLADFSRRRRPDRWLTAGVTDFLPRIFSTGNPLVEHAGGLALLGLDLLPMLRLPLARHLLQGLRT